MSGYYDIETLSHTQFLKLVVRIVKKKCLELHVLVHNGLLVYIFWMSTLTCSSDCWPSFTYLVFFARCIFYWRHLTHGVFTLFMECYLPVTFTHLVCWSLPTELTHWFIDHLLVDSMFTTLYWKQTLLFKLHSHKKGRGGLLSETIATRSFIVIVDCSRGTSGSIEDNRQDLVCYCRL